MRGARQDSDIVGAHLVPRRRQAVGIDENAKVGARRRWAYWFIQLREGILAAGDVLGGAMAASLPDWMMRPCGTSCSFTLEFSASALKLPSLPAAGPRGVLVG